jgi:hypothetical protein
VELLEDRLTPAGAANPGTFFLDGSRQLWVFENGKLTNTGAYAKALSVGTDVQGQPEAYFTDGGNAIWRFDNGVVAQIGGFASQLAAGQGELFFTDGNAQIMIFHEENGGFLNTGGYASQLSLGRNRLGDELYFTDANHRLFRLFGSLFTDTGAYARLLAPGQQGELFFTDGANQIWVYRDANTGPDNPFDLFDPGSLSSTVGFAHAMSVGRDTSGADELFFTDGNNRLFSFDQNVFADKAVYASQVAAGQHGEVFFADGVNHLWVINQTGLTDSGAFAAILAASPNTSAGTDAYFVDGLNQLYQYDQVKVSPLGAFAMVVAPF